MRVLFLILCLTVVYGGCRTLKHEENIDLTTEIQNNGDYKLDHANVPFEIFLSRHRRANLMSSTPLDTRLHLFGFKKAISTIPDLMKFTFGAMTGQNVCSKIEKLSIRSVFEDIIKHPISTVETVVCYILQSVGTTSRTLMGKMFDLSKQFFFSVFLPILHRILNTINDSKFFGPLLPLEIKALIRTFNTIYFTLQLLGLVPKKNLISLF